MSRRSIQMQNQNQKAGEPEKDYSAMSWNELRAEFKRVFHDLSMKGRTRANLEALLKVGRAS